MITLLEHTSSSYAPRTYRNAAQGVTLAIAADHNTAGERLTQKAAGEKIVFVDATKFADQWLDAARLLYLMLRKHDTRVVNVAGNGIYTLAKYGITQVTINDMVRQILFQVDQHLPLDKVVSGGQSGSDLAGLIAAAKIGIPAEGMWPKSFKMRFQDGVDRTYTQQQVIDIINSYA